MWQGRVGCCFLLLAGWVGLAAGPLPAAEKAAKVKAEFHQDGKHQKETFDLNNKEDREKLAQLARAGRLEHLQPDKPVNILELSWDLGLWTVAVFLLLFFVLKKAAWGPMLEGLKKREETIRTAVEEAKIAREETEQVRAQFQAEMAKAHQQIARMMEEARKDAQAMCAQMRTKAQEDIQADRQRLRREIDLALEHALQEIYASAAQLATLISAKAIQRALSEEDHRRLVDEALQELGRVKT